MTKEWTLRELAGETGVTGRTIRFYISRGLLPPPLKAGRGAVYGPAHKILIGKIRELQAGGMMLVEIAQALAMKEGAGARRRMAGKPEVWKDHGSKEEPPVRTDMEPWLGYEDACGSPQVPGPETWRTYPIAPDVVVMIRAGASPWRMRRLLSALERFGSEIRDDGTKKEDRGE